MATKDLTDGKPLNLIIHFMLPIFVGNVFQMLYNIVDAIVVGRGIGINALGAIGATSSIIYLVLSFVFAATQGFSVVLGQRFGAKDYDAVKKSYASSILLSLLMTVILTIVFAPTVNIFLQALNTPLEIFDMASSYLFITFLGIGATVFYNLSANTLRAIGDSRTPLYFLILASVLNIILDVLFIFLFKWQVFSVALSTIIAQAISAILCMGYSYLKFPVLRLSKKDWTTNLGFLYEHIRIGIPMGFQISILSIGKVILQFVLNGFGAAAVAAFTTGMRVDQMFFQFYLALGVTMANYTAQNFGANKISRIKEGAKIAISLVSGFTILFVIVLTLFSEPLAATFMKQPDAQIIQMASQYLHSIMIFLFFLGALLVYRNILQGVGSVVFPVISGVAELIARAACAIIFAGFFGYAGLCFATPMAWLAGAAVLYGGYRLSLLHNFKRRHKIRNN